MIKHVSYNPHLYESCPLELIPEGYVLEKIVPVTEYEFVMVYRKVEEGKEAPDAKE